MAKEFDKIQLKSQTVEGIKCKECDSLMANIDADQLQPGDLVNLKKEGVRISNPETEEPICVNCEVKKTFSRRVADWFESEDNDDDSSFFSGTPSSSGSSFGGSSGFGGFGGGFGGFGGGGFSGGGASRGF